MGKKNYNPAISFIRVIAMLSIILGHVCTAYGINTYQFGGIGVEIFLFISGYLQGNRLIQNPARWGGYRWKRIIPPLWCAVVLCVIIAALLGDNIKVVSLLPYVFCAQGMGSILFNMSVPIISGMGQTWFLTVLMICYALLLCIKNHRLETVIEKHFAITFLFAVTVQVLLCNFGIQIVYFIQFFIGYFFSKSDIENEYNRWVTKKTLLFLTIISLSLGVVRLLANHYIDGTILYDRIIARWSFSIISIWMIAVMVSICRSSMMQSLVQGTVWKVMDIASYPLFLVHYMFLTGSMKVTERFDGVAVQLVMFLVLTVLSATIITMITDGKNLREILMRKRD